MITFPKIGTSLIVGLISAVAINNTLCDELKTMMAEVNLEQQIEAQKGKDIDKGRKEFKELAERYYDGMEQDGTVLAIEQTRGSVTVSGLKGLAKDNLQNQFPVAQTAENSSSITYPSTPEAVTAIRKEHFDPESAKKINLPSDHKWKMWAASGVLGTAAAGVAFAGLSLLGKLGRLMKKAFPRHFGETQNPSEVCDDR